MVKHTSKHFFWSFETPFIATYGDSNHQIFTVCPRVDLSANWPKFPRLVQSANWLDRELTSPRLVLSVNWPVRELSSPRVDHSVRELTSTRLVQSANWPVRDSVVRDLVCRRVDQQPYQWSWDSDCFSRLQIINDHFIWRGRRVFTLWPCTRSWRRLRSFTAPRFPPIASMACLMVVD